MKEFFSLISISEKTGFLNLNNAEVQIFDEEKKPFYFFKPKNKKFNLPKGKYYTNNILKKLQKPLIYNLPKLPKRQRNEIKPVSLLIKKNSSTASIFLDTGQIIVDERKFFKFGKLQRDFVFLHELGHFFYDSEKDADLFACCEMLKIGYNPSQVITAQAGTLRDSETNYKRCYFVLNKLKEKK